MNKKNKSLLRKFFSLLIIISLFSVLFTILILFHGKKVGKIIVITSEGFSPSIITIKQDDIVTFVNKDTSPHWPASNFHPLHSIYPDFDPKKGVLPFSSWSFKFTRPGTWYFHDHLYPTHTGAITVNQESFLGKSSLATFEDTVTLKNLIYLHPYDTKQSPAQYINEQLIICAKNGNTNQCYNEAGFLFSQYFSLKDVLNIIQTNESTPEIYGSCHELTHYIARYSYKNSQDLGKTYTSCDSTCQGGCYHGAIEEYIREKNIDIETAQFSKLFQSTCTNIKNNVTPLAYFECVHGLGHAAMFVTNNALPKALTLCDYLQKDEKEMCYSGVFMENSSSSTSSDHTTRYIKKEDPFYPCDSLEEKYLHICYQYQSSYFAIISNYNWKKTADLCSQVPQDYKDGCFQIIGTNQVGFTQDTSTMIKDCSLLPSEYITTCIRGVVMSLANRFVGNPEKITEFCNQVPDSSRTGCYTQMGQSINVWSSSTNDLRNNCSVISDPLDRDKCLQVAL